MKILIIQQRYGIGDMVIFLPYIHAISKKFNTPISLLAKESSKASDLLGEDKHVDEIITLDKEKDGVSGYLFGTCVPSRSTSFWNHINSCINI